MNNENIFTVGGTVQASNGLYIPRRADDELLALCRKGDFAYVLTPRQLGKSSLMVRTAEQLTKEGVHSVIIDLSQIGVRVTPEEWYLGLLSMIEEQLDLQTNAVSWWRERTHLGITQRLTKFFEEVLLKEFNAPVVVFVDEIDTTLSLDFTDDFFAAIRYFYNARALSKDLHLLSFVLIGVATPGDLIRDPQRTPFNIGQRVDLTDFTFDEALPLAGGFDLEDKQAREVLGWIMKWTHGHPYLTQRLCRAVAAQDRRSLSESDVDRIVASTFFGEKSRQDSNLNFVRDMLTERIPAAIEAGDVFQTYREVRRGQPVEDEEQSLVKSHLKLSGLVRRHNSTLHVRNPIYLEVFDKKWIKQHLPVRYLRKSFRRAVTVAGVMALFAIITVPLAAYAVVRKREAEEQRIIAQQQSRDAQQQRKVAEVLRIEAEKQRDYAESQRDIANQQAAIAKVSELKLKQTQEQALFRANEAERAREQAFASERAARYSQQLAEQNLQKLYDATERNRHNLDGLAAFQRNNYEDALEEFNKALTIINKEGSMAGNKREASELDAVKGQTLASIGAVQRQLGRIPESIKSHEEALKIQASVLEKNSWVLFDTIYGLAHVYDDWAQRTRNRLPGPAAYAQAESYYQQAINFLEEKLTAKQPNQAQLASTLEELARLHRNLNKTDKAEPIYQRALQLRREEVEKSPEALTNILQEVSQFYAGQRKFDKAEAFLLKAIELQEGDLDTRADWRGLIKSYSDLAKIFNSDSENLFSGFLGPFERSRLFILEDPFERDEMKGQTALQIARLIQDIALGLGKAELYETYGNLGDEYIKLAERFSDSEQKEFKATRYKQAEKAYKRAINQPGVSSSPTLTAHYDVRLARLYHHLLKDYINAEKHYGYVVERLDKYAVQKPIGEQEQDARENLASALTGLGQLYLGPLDRRSQVEALLSRALSPTIKHNNFTLIAETLNALADLYVQEKRDVELEQVYKNRIVNALTRMHVTFDPLTYLSLELPAIHSYDTATINYLRYNKDLIDFYLARKRISDAEYVYKQILEEMPSQLPSLKPNGTGEIYIGVIGTVSVLAYYAQMLENYQKLLISQGRSADAAKIAERITEIEKRMTEIKKRQERLREIYKHWTVRGRFGVST